MSNLPGKDGVDKGRDLNAEILGNAIYKTLVDENYPDLREEDIERVIDKFTKKPCGERKESPCGNGEPAQREDIDRQNYEFWKHTTLPQKTPAVKIFLLDLKQSLRENRFFKLIIDEAVAKRLDLFQASGSPLKPMENALTKVDSFVMTNVGDKYAAQISAVQKSPLGAFIEVHKAYFQRPDPVGIMNKDELSKFESKIQQELLAVLKKEPDLGKALDLVLRRNKKYLNPKGTETPSGNQKAKPEELQSWKNSIKENQKVKDTFEALDIALKERQTAKSQFDAVKITEWDQSLSEAIVKAKSAATIPSDIGESIASLKEIFVNIGSGDGAIVNLVEELNNKIQTQFPANPLPQNNINEVRVKKDELRDKLIYVDRDEKGFEKIEKALEYFNLDKDISEETPYPHSTNLAEYEGFKTKFETVETDADALLQEIRGFLRKVKAHTSFADQDIKRLVGKIEAAETVQIEDPVVNAMGKGKPALGEIGKTSFKDKFKVLKSKYETYASAKKTKEDKKKTLDARNTAYESAEVAFLQAVGRNHEILPCIACE